MTTKTNTNGATRKSLAEEIDRLEGLVDSLGEGLNEAVATAVEQAVSTAVSAAVREAVQGVLKELLASPDFLALLRAAVGPAGRAAPGRGTAPVLPRLREAAAKAAAWAKARLREAREACGAGLRKVRRGVATAWGCLGLLPQFRVPLLVALGVGAAAGAGCYFAGPWLAAAAGAVAGFVTTLAVRAALALRRVLAAVSAP